MSIACLKQRRMKMKKRVVLRMVCVIVLMSCAGCTQPTAKEIPLDVLKDKIKGGWAGQTISCTYGGPTEFRFRSKMIPDDHEIPWFDGYMKDTYDGRPGLYDDIYMGELQALANLWDKRQRNGRRKLAGMNHMAQNRLFSAIMVSRELYVFPSMRRSYMEFRVNGYYRKAIS